MNSNNVGKQLQDYVHMTTAEAARGIITDVQSRSSRTRTEHPLNYLNVRPVSAGIRAGHESLMHGVLLRGPATPSTEDARPDSREEGSLLIKNPKKFKVIGGVHPHPTKPFTYIDDNGKEL